MTQVRAGDSGAGLLRTRRQGQGEVEGDALAEFALSPDAASVGLHDMLDDREAEPGSARLAERALSMR